MRCRTRVRCLDRIGRRCQRLQKLPPTSNYRFLATEGDLLSTYESGLLSLTLLEAAEQLKQGQTTSIELTKACLKQIRRARPFNAYITECADSALAAAEQFDIKRAKGEPTGPIGGIPIAVKDNFCTNGIKTTAASKMLESYIPPFDSTVTSRLQRAGAIVIGKTNMDEFGMGSANIFSAYGPTISPWSVVAGQPVSAGGSSGGSAAALASSTCFAAVGSDTGGSIRLPAAWCGLVGLKPTYGVSSRYGLIQYASSLDTPALLAKTTKDAKTLLDIIVGEDEKDSTSVGYTSRVRSERKPLIVGVPKEYFVAELPQDTLSKWQESISQFERMGHKVVEISLPHTAEALSAYYVIAPAEASSNLARYDGVRYGYRVEGSTLQEQFIRTRTDAFGKEVQRRILMGAFTLSRKSYESYYKKAQQIRRLVQQDFDDAFSAGVDVILTPTSPVPAPSIESLSLGDPVNMYMMDVMTIPANMAGLPAINVPTGTSSNGLPVGFQLLAARFNEETLLSAAEILELAWNQKNPSPPLLNRK